jgi:hypothetical protein
MAIVAIAEGNSQKLFKPRAMLGTLKDVARSQVGLPMKTVLSADSIRGTRRGIADSHVDKDMQLY